jgi:drug/metabolite transporter (DMT)-like permease
VREVEAMQRARSILGLVAGATMMLSSAAHSLLGSRLLRAALEKVQAEHELISALAIGRFDPFFLVFVVPGLMVLLASFGRREV